MRPEGQGASGSGGAGRLSGLSDETLVRVLRHLKPWEAMRARLLSRRWRRPVTAAIATAPRLDIRQPCGCRDDGKADQSRAEAFASFVRDLLLRQRLLVPLDALRLCWSHPARDGDADKWIAHAVMHGAKEIELSGAHHAVYPSPDLLSYVNCNYDASIIIIRLRIAKFIHVRLDGAALTQFCSGCPSLEELELTDCLILPSREDSIRGPVPSIRSTWMKHFTMNKCPILKGLMVYAPKLESFRWSGTFGYVPWIENFGPVGTANAPHMYPACSDLASCKIKILMFSRIKLDGVTLSQLCSRCSSLEELELKDCSVEGKEIHSTCLKRLNLVGCKFVVGFSVYSPNLVSLRCIRPFGYVPSIQNLGHLVTATVMLDDLCLCNDRRWPQKVDQQEKSDVDDDFFAHAGSKDSDGNSFAHSAAEESGNNNHNDSDDNSTYYDSDWSEPSDDEEDDRFICYSDIAHEQRKQYKYWINGNNHSAGGHRDDCSENSNFGGSGMLCSLSNVKTMDLLAHPEEMVLMRELKYCPNFRNLKTLSLGEWCMTPQLDALANILNHSPNLENFIVHLDLAFNSRVGIDPQGSSFSCTNLKRVSIICCNRDIMVHRLVKFLIENGISDKKIFVQRTASSTSGSAKGDAVSPAKHKAESEAEKRDAKQRKLGTRGRTRLMYR